MSGIYIWGTGCGAGETAELLGPEIEIAGFVDSFPQSARFLDRPVLRPEALPALDPALVIVSARQSDEILERCGQLGLPRDRLLFTKNYLRLADRNESRARARALLGEERLKRLLPPGRVIREPLNARPSPLPERDLENDYVRLKTLELCCGRLDGVPGAAAELGVYRGAFAACINALLPDRTLWLFDSFEGFDPEEAERELALGRAGEGLIAAHRNTGAEAVLARMLHPETVVIRQGLFPASLEGLEERFALVSLDADLEDSTYAGLCYFVPRMNPGGYLFLHDWDAPKLVGVRRALARFERERGGKLPALPLPDLNGSLVLCF